MLILKPCPFCGGDAEIDCDSSVDISWSVDNAVVECISCQAKTDVYWADNLDVDSCSKAINDATNAWNKRVTEGKLI